MKKLITLLSLLLIVTGCTTHIASVTGISTKEIHAKHVDLDKFQISKNIEGTDTSFCPFGIPLFKLSHAVDDALRRGDGDLLINGDIYVTNYFALIGSICSFKIKGDVINLKKQKNNS